VQLQDFDYELPAEYIAQEPLPERDQSRLLVLDRRTGEIEHRRFADIAGYLQPDDLMVLNDTRVVATRLCGRKITGGAVEALLLSKVAEQRWRAMVKPGRRVPVGARMTFGDGELTAVAVDRLADGGRILEFTCDGDCDGVIARLGEVPLPPYICRKLEDRERYQTIYAERDGSAAAPPGKPAGSPGASARARA
jgi:S-adenosylmethionine:tRNA ribosyltransferase-isomerase